MLDGATLLRARFGAVVFFAAVFAFVVVVFREVVFAAVVLVVFRVVVFVAFVALEAFEAFGADFAAEEFALRGERLDVADFGDLSLSFGTIKTSLLLLMIIAHFSALFNSCFFE